MRKRTYDGFGSLKIASDIYGDEDQPCVILLPGATQSRRVWHNSAVALARAGRFVVSLDLRGHGESGRAVDGNYNLDALIADLVAVLGQLSSRPVIVGSTLGGWVALTALGEANVPLATGLVIANPPPEMNEQTVKYLSETVLSHGADTESDGDYDRAFFSGGFDFRNLESRLQSAAKKIKVPTLIVRGTDSQISSDKSINVLEKALSRCEFAEIVDGGHYVAFDRSDEFNALLLGFLEREVPRETPEFVTGSDARTLRDAMGCFATGVTIVTTRGADGAPAGLTANSFTSVSLDPPLVLVCIANTAGSMSAFHDASAFAINILHIGQQPASNLFASKGSDRFLGVEWENWDLNVPIISDSLASFECMKTNAIEQGDHTILVGQILRAKYEPRRDPLLYFNGKYRRLHLN